MKAFPIIPIWLMIIITIGYLVLVIMNRNNNILKLIIRILIIIFAFIINLRFMVYDGSAEGMNSNLDVAIVVDTSISMNAEDYQGTNTRLSAVKNDLKYIMDKLPGPSYAVITYDSKSYIRSPFTVDRDSIDVVVNTMAPKLSLYSKGSNLTAFKDDLKYLLENSKKKENHKRIVILITDGELTNNNKLESLSELRDLIDEGVVLGYGTTKGGEMREKKYSSSTELEYIEDRTQGKYPAPHAVSKIDENNLKQMARDLGVDYVHMDKQSNIDSKIKSIINNADLTSSGDIETYRDTYYPFAIILSLLVLVELYLDKREYL